jgi:hypothetical protein
MRTGNPLLLTDGGHSWSIPLPNVEQFCTASTFSFRGDRRMSVFGKNAVSDRDLLKTISQRIARTGTASSSKVNVMVQGGTVTLSGSLQYAIQRNPIFRAVENIPGVRRVVDQLIVVDRKKARPDADSTRFYEASKQVPVSEPA